MKMIRKMKAKLISIGYVCWKVRSRSSRWNSKRI